ncbi:hypothetical protein ACFL9T_11185 [Thermodesulfobacteriota bacterium]
MRLSKETGIRIIGPNCMGIYCPESGLSFDEEFPEESGPVAFLSQSGGNVNNIVRQAKWRGVRFSKVISYGNACDLNECDFLEYLAHDRDARVLFFGRSSKCHGIVFCMKGEKAFSDTSMGR